MIHINQTWSFRLLLKPILLLPKSKIVWNVLRNIYPKVMISFSTSSGVNELVHICYQQIDPNIVIRYSSIDIDIYYTILIHLSSTFLNTVSASKLSSCCCRTQTRYPVMSTYLYKCSF